MSTPKKQVQHKIPEVYQKKWGYQSGNQWKVSVIEAGEKFSRQKSIGSFTAIENHFDIESDDPKIWRSFESLNSDLDNRYNSILNELESDGKLSRETDDILVQFTANLICRSDFWRDFVNGFFYHPNKENFIRTILWSQVKENTTREELEQLPLYRFLVD